MAAIVASVPLLVILTMPTPGTRRQGAAASSTSASVGAP